MLLISREQDDRLGADGPTFAHVADTFTGFCLHADSVYIDLESGRQVLTHRIDVLAELRPFKIYDRVDVHDPVSAMLE